MSSEKIEVSAFEHVNEAALDESTEAYRAMEKRVLWKFDLHILPPLALVWAALPPRRAR